MSDDDYKDMNDFIQRHEAARRLGEELGTRGSLAEDDDEPEVTGVLLRDGEAVMVGVACPGCGDVRPLKVPPPGSDPIRNPCGECGHVTSAMAGIQDENHVLVVILHNDTDCKGRHGPKRHDSLN